MDEFLTPDVHFDAEWSKVQPTVDELLAFLKGGMKALTKKKLFGNDVRMRAYTVTYKLASETEESYKEKLYTKHRTTIQTFLENSVLSHLTSKRGNALLKAFVEQWELFKILNLWMEYFFRYLDNFYVKYKNVDTLNKQGSRVFREVIFVKVKDDVTEALLGAINLERVGESSGVEHSTLKSCIAVYRAMDPVELTDYVTFFETQLLEDVARYMAKQSQIWMVTDSTPEYLIKTERAIESEAQRVLDYMWPTTEEKIKRVCAETLLKDQETQLLEKENSGVRALLKQDKKDDLARMFKLFNQVEGGLPPMAQIMRSHIVDEGRVIIDKRTQELANAEGKESGNDAGFIQALLELHERYSTLVAKEFGNHREFQKELKYAFENTVNTDIGKHTNAELLSSYADSVLKTGGDDKLTDSQIEDVLEKVVSLLAFVTDKDIFADVFRNHLAKRLLNQRSVSAFAEKSMIQKLKMKHGAQFTSKFEGMLNDLALNEDGHKAFSKFLIEHPNKLSGLEFTVDVLTTGHWPSFKMISPTLPPQMKRALDAFEEYYSSNTDHRKLSWVHSLGNVTVKGNFKISYDFQVTTLQALVMLIFNQYSDGKTALTMNEINEKMGKIEVEVLKRVLHSLSCQKVHILVKEPEGKRIEEGDKFKLLVDFQSKIRKVRIPMASLDDTLNPQRVEEDRGLAIEAAIVRIMKARKRLAHQILITEVVSQLRTFKPEPKTIKKKVEHLIEREYLKRDDNEPNVYHYLA